MRWLIAADGEGVGLLVHAIEVLIAVYPDSPCLSIVGQCVAKFDHKVIADDGKGNTVVGALCFQQVQANKTRPDVVETCEQVTAAWQRARGGNRTLESQHSAAGMRGCTGWRTGSG